MDEITINVFDSETHIYDYCLGRVVALATLAKWEAEGKYPTAWGYLTAAEERARILPWPPTAEEKYALGWPA